MKKDNHHIDNIFRDGLANSTATPPSFIWDSIEKQLNTNKKHRRALVIWRSVSAAAIIGLVFLAGLFWHINPNNSHSSILTQNKNVEEVNSSSSKNTIVNKSTPQHKISNPIIQDNQAYDSIYTSPSEDVNISIKTIEQIKPKSESESCIVKPIFVFTDPILTKKLPKGITEINSYKQVNATQLFNYQNNSLRSYASATSIFLDPFTPPKITKEKKNIQIALGGQFSPSYSYREASSTENDNTSAAQESGIVSYTGGLNLNIKTPKRWSIETGIYYAQVGQKFSNPMYEVLSTPSYYSAKLSDKPKPTTNNTGLNLNNSLGKIKLSNNQENQQVQPSNYLMLSYSDTQNSYNKIETLTIQQELDYIEVPFLLRYDIINKSIIFSFSGGVSTNFLIGNNAYQINNNSKEKIGETENINNINYTAVFGVGFRTPIWKSIEFNLEPRIRYFINSVTNSDDYNYHPYSIGIYTGISYRFK